MYFNVYGNQNTFQSAVEPDTVMSPRMRNIIKMRLNTNFVFHLQRCIEWWPITEISLSKAVSCVYIYIEKHFAYF